MEEVLVYLNVSNTKDKLFFCQNITCAAALMTLKHGYNLGHDNF